MCLYIHISSHAHVCMWRKHLTTLPPTQTQKSSLYSLHSPLVSASHSEDRALSLSFSLSRALSLSLPPVSLSAHRQQLIRKFLALSRARARVCSASQSLARSPPWITPCSQHSWLRKSVEVCAWACVCVCVCVCACVCVSLSVNPPNLVFHLHFLGESAVGFQSHLHDFALWEEGGRRVKRMEFQNACTYMCIYV